MQAIQYNNAGGINPTDGDRTIGITLTDGTGGTSAVSTVTVNVNPVNEAPTATGLVTDFTVLEDTSGSINLSALDITDNDSATVTVTLDLAEGTFDFLGDGNDDGVTETLVDSDTVTLAGSVADIETYLDEPNNIVYLSAADAAGESADTLSVSINDGDGSGDVSLGTVNIDITAVQDVPVSSGGSSSVTTGLTLTFSQNSFNFADVDDGDTFASVRIDTLPTEGTLKLSDVDVTAGQVIAAADISSLTYSAPSGSATSASFTYSVNDGTDFSASPATMVLTLTTAAEQPPEQPPEQPGSPSPEQPNNPPTAPTLSGLSVQENSPGAVVGSVHANDPDIDSITYSVSDSRFEIVGTTLKLKAGQSVDFEAQETIGLTITATDSNNASQSSSFTIAVRDVNEEGSTEGDDAITGVDGDDNIQSAGGDDVVSSGDGKDTVDGGTGNDDIDGGDDDDLLFGGSGQDTVKGGTGQDTLRGGSGSDMVEAGSGNDLVFAGLGDDGNDTVDGDIGNDTLGGGFGGDNINGGDGDDLLWGEVGDDSLSGGGGNDLIYNGEGSDTVAGGDGDDTIWAGEDDDLLTGGEGADLFVFGDVSGNDTITDFDASEDVLDVEYASTDFTSLADVVAAGSETSQGGQAGVLLDLGDSDSVFIIGIQLDDLTTDNITF
jgi:Ca2+-binding RTX toxin-like protein